MSVSWCIQVCYKANAASGETDVVLIIWSIDLKAENILQQIRDDSLFERFTAHQLVYPSPRKFLGDLTIYGSESFQLPTKFGLPVLADLSAAVKGEKARDDIAQPDLYRAPEVMLKASWSYPVDIWNVGVMVQIFLPFESSEVKLTTDRSGTSWRTRASSLAEMVGAKATEQRHTWQR